MNNFVIITGSHFSGKTTTLNYLKKDKRISNDYLFVNEVALKCLRDNPDKLIDNIPNENLQDIIFQQSKVDYYVNIQEDKNYICDRWILDNICYDIALRKHITTIETRKKLCYSIFNYFKKIFNIKVFILNPLELKEDKGGIRNDSRFYQKQIYDLIKNEYQKISPATLQIIQETDKIERLDILKTFL